MRKVSHEYILASYKHTNKIVIHVVLLQNSLIYVLSCIIVFVHCHCLCVFADNDNSSHFTESNVLQPNADISAVEDRQRTYPDQLETRTHRYVCLFILMK